MDGVRALGVGYAAANTVRCLVNMQKWMGVYSWWLSCSSLHFALFGQHAEVDGVGTLGADYAAAQWRNEYMVCLHPAAARTLCVQRVCVQPLVHPCGLATTYTSS